MASSVPIHIDSEFGRSTLPNGIRVVSERLEHVASVSLGVWVWGGSQLEPPPHAGITHFIEHMLFKGTATRDSVALASEIENVGGRIGAETDKEYTCFSAKVLAEHLPLALDIISDMLLRSTYRPNEIMNEKKVVLEEIKLYEDAPDELVHDLFAETLWSHHPLGRPVIGSYDAVARLTREDLIGHVAENYVGNRIVVSACGAVDHQELCDLVSQYFHECPPGVKPTDEIAPPVISHSRCVMPKDTEQVHFCFGTGGYNMHDQRRYPLSTIDAVLSYGGSSRLFQEIREKRGLTYGVSSYSVSYRDAGCFAISGSTTPANVDEVVELSMLELRKIREGNITAEELARSKAQMKTSILFGKESVGSRMAWMGRSETCYDRLIPYEEVVANMEAVDHDAIAEVAEDLFSSEEYTFTAIGPNGTMAMKA